MNNWHKHKKFLVRRLATFAFLLLLSSLIFASQLVTKSSADVQSAPSLTISQTRIGLIKQDSLTSGNTNYWTFGGDAPEEGAPFNYFENSIGLHIGVQAVSSGVFAGFFAKSQITQGQLFHATINMPYTSIPDNDFNVGLYVQTSQPLINYIFCGADSEPGGYSWDVVEAFGNSQQATQFQILYSHSGGPLTRQCTIITNGNNYLKVYIDSQLVYLNKTANQQMPSPFNAYLEVETSSPDQLYYGNYTNYYSTITENVRVTHVPASSTVELVGSTGKVLVSQHAGSSCDSKCHVNLEVADFSLPLTAKVEVIQLGSVIASTSLKTIWAGDTYTLS